MRDEANQNIDQSIINQPFDENEICITFYHEITMSKFYFLSVMTLLTLVACSQSKNASAKLELSMTNATTEDIITGSAKGSTYERLYWYVGGVLQPDCQNKIECEFMFDEVGEFKIKLEASVTPVSGIAGWQTRTKSSITKTVIIQ